MILAAAIVLALTYIGVAFAHVPRLNIDRPSAAFIGGVLMVLLGVMSVQEAAAAINVDTISLLLGMMLVGSTLQSSGVMTYLAARALAIGVTPLRLLGVVVAATALLSAFFVNDAVVLLFTPVVIQTARALGANPIPYLIAEAMASNIGSAATIVGNPQNMLIGVVAGISFTKFFLLLLPVSVLSAAVLFLVVWWLYRREFRLTVVNYDPAPTATISVANTARMLVVVVPMLAAFFFSASIGVDPSLVALAAGAGALLIGGVKPLQIMRGVDWVLLLFFAGLFVVMGGAQKAGLLNWALDSIKLQPGFLGILSIHAVSLVASQVVSNVPYTMLAIPILEKVPGHVLWLSLASAATLGGNLTLMGAVANLIVASGAEREGVSLSFWQFFRVGLIVTAVTLVISLGVLTAEFELGILR